MVSGVDRLPDRDSARLIGAGLADTTAYRATVYRLSVVPIRDNQADFLRFYTDMLSAIFL